MQKIFKIFLIIFLINPVTIQAKEFAHILNDKCITALYKSAKETLSNTSISVIRDPQGIILRFELTSPDSDYHSLTPETYIKILQAESFLSKIENPAIIEVHTENIPKEALGIHKNWEISTVIANRIEDIIIKKCSKKDCDRIYSVGYGEFLPAKNTSNNGVNYPNRVDIMIICNVSGE